MNEQALTRGHKSVLPPIGVPVCDIHPYGVDVLKDPYPFFHALLAKGPFAYVPKYSILMCGG